MDRKHKKSYVIYSLQHGEEIGCFQQEYFPSTTVFEQDHLCGSILGRLFYFGPKLIFAIYYRRPGDHEISLYSVYVELHRYATRQLNEHFVVFKCPETV